MTQGRVDFLIMGASPQAWLLAGMLAERHSKSVLLQGSGQWGSRVPHGIELSIAAITRPQSWALLTQTVPEATRRITRIGKRASVTRLDPVLFADDPQGKQALHHVHHMAEAHGVAAEPMPENFLGKGREGLLLRDAVLLERTRLEPALDVWLTQSGVRRLAADAPVALHPDGSAECRLDGETISVGQTILADDAAIIGQLAEASWPTLLQRQRASTIMTAPTAPIAAPVMLALDHGVVLHQREGGSLIAYGLGEIAALSDLLRRLLGPQQSFQHVGQTSYVRLLTRDGAPAVGRVDGSGPDVLAGFGTIGAFVAPALARWLSGSASPAEDRWFGARLVNRLAENPPVSDIGALP